MGLMSGSLLGLQSQMFWEFISQVEVFKVGVPNVAYKTFIPQGEALGFEFPPNSGLP